MNLTATMAGNRDGYMLKAQGFCKPSEALAWLGFDAERYAVAKSLGLSDQEIVANVLAEADEAIGKNRETGEFGC